MDASKKDQSNLTSFLDSITPSVEVRFAPKSSFRDLNTKLPPVTSKGLVEYFTLGDFWKSYYEWSACGVGVPILLKNGKSIVQYYSPTLSAIQIYKHKDSSRNGVEGPESRDSTEDTGSGSLSLLFEDTSNDYLSLSLAKEQGDLYFQFSDEIIPYKRKPLLDKVHEFAKDYPGLMSLDNIELSPSSWISIAWYPIYAIPCQRNTKELAACFLTYHSFNSFPLQDTTKMSKYFSFAPFGLATYKMISNFWINPEDPDKEMMAYHLSCVKSWLRGRDIKHHDYIFFCGFPTWN